MVSIVRPGQSYLPRIIDAELAQLLADLPAVSLDGPKGVGKTSTARQVAASAFDLDDPVTLDLIRSDPERLTLAAEPVLIDEWHRYPPAWDIVRRAVDDDARPGRFILTGSASPKSPATHSGAGRILPIRMRPMTLPERGVGSPTVGLGELLSGTRAPLTGDTDVGLTTYVDEMLASGLPGIRGAAPRSRRRLLDGYLQLVIDRDFPDAGAEVRYPTMLRRWMTACAAATATSATHESIRDAATGGEGDKPAKSTTIPYRDTLERLWILDPLAAWAPTHNHLQRLTNAPKHHLVDPALSAALVGATADSLLSGSDQGPRAVSDGPFLGALFESMAALTLRVFAQHAEARVFHLRTFGGRHEVDLIIERPDGRVVAIEVKLSSTVDNADVKHLAWLADEIGDQLLDAVVVTTGRHAYRRRDGIGVVPLALLGP